MPTECISKQLEFQGLGRRQVVADFKGGRVTSDAGALLLREVGEGSRILEQFSSCFVDQRNPLLVEHGLLELLAQRVYGIALGYEDLNDHDWIRHDALLATLVGKTDPTGENRVRERDRGKPLAGKSTLNRLELAPPGGQSKHRYHRIVCLPDAVDRFFVDVFLQAHEHPPESIVLDLDATDDQLHGGQEGRFFHGHYDGYCYLPLYIFCEEHLLCARLRTADRGVAVGAVDEVKRIVSQIRQRWPDVQITLRGDSDFSTDEIMNWCEDNEVDFVFGLQQNVRLLKRLRYKMRRAEQQCRRSGQATRCFREFTYQTRKSWSRPRRVIGKAEHLPGLRGANPRFVVTSLPKDAIRARTLYEALYCARGDMENRIKEQQLGLFADRTSSATFCANQLRLWFSSVAYVLLQELRRVGLKGTEMARAQCTTIRNKLLKIGAVVSVSVRRVWVRCASGYPLQRLFVKVLSNLREHYALMRL